MACSARQDGFRQLVRPARGQTIRRTSRPAFLALDSSRRVNHANHVDDVRATVAAGGLVAAGQLALAHGCRHGCGTSGTAEGRKSYRAGGSTAALAAREEVSTNARERKGPAYGWMSGPFMV